MAPKVDKTVDKTVQYTAGVPSKVWPASADKAAGD